MRERAPVLPGLRTLSKRASLWSMRVARKLLAAALIAVTGGATAVERAQAELKPVEVTAPGGGPIVSPKGTGPSFLASPPGDDRRIFIVTQDGYVLLMVDGVLQPEPFLDLSDRTDTVNENGMFSIAFDPDWAENGIFYVNYSDLSGGPGSQLNDHKILAFRRSTSDPNKADPTTEREILTIPSSKDVGPECEKMTSPHYGGQLQTGPDGLLWISIGDGGDNGAGGEQCDARLQAKDLGKLQGKIIRIKPDPYNGDYEVPEDNPLVGVPGARPEVFAYGMRNPWRFAFDPEPPHDIVIGDVGEESYEDLSVIPSSLDEAPRFLGWPCWEGPLASPLVDQPCAAEHPHVEPRYAHQHQGGCTSLTAGPFIRDPSLGAEYQGRVIFGFFCDGGWPSGGKLYTVDPDGDDPPRLEWEPPAPTPGLSSFGVDGCGRIYALNNRNAEGVWRIEGDELSDCGKKVTIASGPSGAVSSKSASFSATTDLTGQDVVFTCELDGHDVPCPGGQATLTDLAEGEHTLTVRAGSAAQRLVAKPASRTWTVDTVPPETTITAKPPALTNDPSLRFEFSASEPDVDFTCKLDDGPAVPCSSPHTFEDVADGEHTVTIVAVDKAGNVDANPATAQVTVDTVPPAVSITSGPPELTNDRSLKFAFESDDPTASFTCKLDDGPAVPCGSPHTFNDVPDGGHVVRIAATDPAGNEGAATAQVAVDSTPPDTFITDAHLDGTTLRFAFTSSEPGSTFHCSFNGQAWFMCASPLVHPGAAPGAHTLFVRATDKAGNVDPTPATASLTVPEPQAVPPVAQPQPPTIFDQPPAGLGQPPAVPPSPAPAPPRLIGAGTVRASSAGKVRLRLAPHPQGGRVTIAVRYAGRAAAPAKRVTLRPGRATDVQVTLDRRHRRLLRKRGRLRLTVRITIAGGKAVTRTITVRRR